jgi:hypothetical protein
MRILGQVKEPVIIHWLGEMSDWRSPATGAAATTTLRWQRPSRIRDNVTKADGIKISLLSKVKEIVTRAALRRACACVHRRRLQLSELIEGDDRLRTLLGIFDAPAAALRCGLSSGDTAAFHETLAPTLPLSRHIFSGTRSAADWRRLSGLSQRPARSFPYGRRSRSARSLVHLAELFRLADAHASCAIGAGGDTDQARDGA